MEPEGSVSCSHESATGPCPEPDYSSPRPSIAFLQDQFSCHPTKYAYLLTDFFPSGFPTKTLYAFLFLAIRATCPDHFIRLTIIFQIILCMCVCVWGGGWGRVVHIVKLLFMQLSPVFFYFHLLGAIYLPQHHILKHGRSSVLCLI